MQFLGKIQEKYKVLAKFDIFEIGHKKNAEKLQGFIHYGTKLMAILDSKYGRKFRFNVPTSSTTEDPMFEIEMADGQDIPAEFLKEIGHRRVLKGFPAATNYSNLVKVFGE